MSQVRIIGISGWTQVPGLVGDAIENKAPLAAPNSLTWNTDVESRVCCDCCCTFLPECDFYVWNQNGRRN